MYSTKIGVSEANGVPEAGNTTLDANAVSDTPNAMTDAAEKLDKIGNNHVEQIENDDTMVEMEKPEKPIKLTREVTISDETPGTSSSSTSSAMSHSQELAARRRQFMSQPSTVASRRQQAVCVRRANKSYGPKKNPNVILDGLNMTVPKGSMYVCLLIRFKSDF